MWLARVLLFVALLASAPAVMAQEESTDGSEAVPAMEQPVNNNSGDQPTQSAPVGASPVIKPGIGPGDTPPSPCARVTEGFDLPTRPPCRPDQLQPVLPGFITATLISLPQATHDGVAQPTYNKPSYPSAVPLSCIGGPYCPQSVGTRFRVRSGKHSSARFRWALTRT